MCACDGDAGGEGGGDGGVCGEGEGVRERDALKQAPEVREPPKRFSQQHTDLLSSIEA